MFRLVLLVALVLRIAAAFVWQGIADAEGKRFRFGDSETYWTLAEKIVDGKPYDYAGPDSRIFRAPVYPLFLAPATLLDGRAGLVAGRLMGAIAGTSAVGLVMLAATWIAGRRAGYWAGILAACYPGAVGMSIFILSEAIFTPLMLASLLSWYRSGTSQDRIAWGALSGTASGLALLARPSWSLWPACLAIVVIVSTIVARLFPTSHSETILPRKSAFGRLLLFFGALVLVCSPWWYRNYLLTGRFVPTTLQVGASLYDGWHEGASGTSDEGMGFAINFEQALRAEDKEFAKAQETGKDAGRGAAVHRDTFEWRLNQRMFDAAVRWAMENRSDAFRLALVKFVKTWSPWPTAKELGGAWVRIAESVTYIIVLALAVIALWRLPTARAGMMLYASPTVYFAALHTIFVGSVRYRQPAMLILCVVAGIGAAWMLNQFEDQSPLRRTLKR